MKVWIVSLIAMLAAFTGSAALAEDGGIHLCASPVPCWWKPPPF